MDKYLKDNNKVKVNLTNEIYFSSFSSPEIYQTSGITLKFNSWRTPSE